MKLRKPSRKELKLAFINPVFVVEVVFLVIFLSTFGIVASFPDYIKVQGTIDLMKALVDVDGILLGFVGIVFAQLFSSVFEQQNIIFQRKLDNPKQQSYYDIYLKEYSKRKKTLVTATIATFTLLLISILLSLISLARVSLYDPLKDTYAPFGLTFGPMIALVEAVAILVIALVGVSTELPKVNSSPTLCRFVCE
jgi:hypothetical protein